MNQVVRVIILSVLCVLSVSACAKKALPELDELPKNYDLHIDRSCFCGPDWRGEYKVSVRHGRIAQAQHLRGDATGQYQWLPLDNNDKSIPTLHTVHKLLRDAQERKAYRVDLTWSKPPIVPKKVYVDFSKMMADEERGYTVLDYKLLD